MTARTRLGAVIPTWSVGAQVPYGQVFKILRENKNTRYCVKTSQDDLYEAAARGRVGA